MRYDLTIWQSGFSATIAYLKPTKKLNKLKKQLFCRILREVKLRTTNRNRARDPRNLRQAREKLRKPGQLTFKYRFCT